MLETLILSVAIGLAPQQQTDTTFSVDPGGRLEVENHNGDITVRSWDRDAVRIQARHRAGIRLDIDRAGSLIRLEAEGRGGPPQVVYEITVPRTLGLGVDTHNGNVSVDGVAGDVEVETLNGNIVVRGGNGRIELESVSGEIVLDGARGSIETATVNRGIRITRSSGDISAETVNGSIVLSEIESSNVVGETVNGRITYAGTVRDDGRYNLASHNGNITFTIPESANASVTVTTHNGTIETDFEVQVREIRSHRRLSFTLGAGGARIDLETFGGSVELRRPNR